MLNYNHIGRRGTKPAKVDKKATHKPPSYLQNLHRKTMFAVKFRLQPFNYRSLSYMLISLKTTLLVQEYNSKLAELQESILEDARINKHKYEQAVEEAKKLGNHS